MYTKEKCIACGACVEACEPNACWLTPDGIVTDPDLCLLCGDCADVCPSKATEMSGESMTVKDVMKIISRDKALMDESSGGVTFSGGEPLTHPNMLKELLDECGKLGIHRCVDTSGMANSELILDFAKRAEMFLYDLKIMDSKRHREFTGVGNETILKNLSLLAETGVDLVVRIPLVKDVNDDDENILQTAVFIAALPGESKPVNLLPYHASAAKKHEKLGQENISANYSEPSVQRQEAIIKIFRSQGVQASIGG